MITVFSIELENYGSLNYKWRISGVILSSSRISHGHLSMNRLQLYCLYYKSHRVLRIDGYLNLQIGPRSVYWLKQWNFVHSVTLFDVCSPQARWTQTAVCIHCNELWQSNGASRQINFLLDKKLVNQFLLADAELISSDGFRWPNHFKQSTATQVAKKQAETKTNANQSW